MSPIAVIITIVVYFALLLTISWIASRGSDNNSFFTGGRRMPWIAVAFAMVGAAISGVTFISVPGMVVAKSYSYLQMVLGFIVGYFLVAWVLVPIFYRQGLVSIYGYLGSRFGKLTYKTGAWFFFLSKMLGAAVRFFVVCAVLQLLVFKPLGIPFEFNVIVTIALIWLYTFRGGVGTLVWTDLLKTFCLVMSVALCIYFVATNLRMGAGDVISTISDHATSRIFFFDDPKSDLYFWKQFIAGVFLAIATNGLDQDMMQRNLACRDFSAARKNMIVSSVMQFFVIALFLILGTLLVVYVDRMGIEMPAKTDELFGLVATHPTMPVVVGILFVLGLIAAAYSAAGSALTSLTTSFTIDIMGHHPDKDKDAAKSKRLSRTRKAVHVAMSVVMGLVIIAFYYISSEDAISAVYTLASYTYGPILGLFAYGMVWHRPTRDRLVPFACLASPFIAMGIAQLMLRLWDYHTGFELLLINAAVTFLLLLIISIRMPHVKQTV